MSGARPTMLLYLLLATLILTAWAGGAAGISSVRVLYLAGCIGVAYQAVRFGPGYHFEALVVLFAFSPFLRRIVDYECGYDPLGLMLTGPLLAGLVPTAGLATSILSKRGHLIGRLGPYLLTTLTLSYAALVLEFSGQYVPAVAGFGKSMSVLLYGCWLLAAAEDPRRVVRHGARAFLVVLPVVSIYGYIQYIDPSSADRYWMISSAMSSVGYPEPQRVRVFSTLNSPESMANFIVFGLLLIAVLRRFWEVLLCSGPAVVALLLSQARTAWVALAAAIFYSFFFSKTWLRCTLLAGVVLVAGTFAVVATPAGDIIATRLQTLTDSTGGDFSGEARLDEFQFIFNHVEDYLFGGVTEGSGKTGWETNTRSLAASDGLIVSSIQAMGIIGGPIFIFGVVWAALQGLAHLQRRAEPEFVVAGGLVFGQLVVIPLSNPTGAEFGILFWSLIAIAARTPPKDHRRPPIPVSAAGGPH